MNIVAIIIARGGSKGIPYKNIINFCGKPLISWTIEHVINVKKINSVWVSSDDEKILSVARQYDINTIHRPQNLSNDTATSESAWLHAIQTIEGKGEKIDIVVAPQVTSPLREPKDIENGINKFIAEGYDSIFSSCIAEDLYFWEKKNGSLRSVNYDYKNRKRRQDINKQFIENGSFYIFKPEVLRTYNNRFGEKIGIVEMELWKLFEIDTYTDIKICEALMKSFLL